MKSARGFLFLSLVLLATPASGFAALPAAGGASSRGPHASPALIDNGARMDANNLDMVVTNHGSLAFDLITGNAGLVFPRGSGHTVVFAAGPWIGALVNGQVRVAIGEYAQEYVPGPMQDGTFQPDQPRFKSYKIVQGNTTSSDYLNWPVADGAPVDGNGNPLLLGDATIWSVYNDANPGVHTANPGQTLPLGVEVQQTVFAFDRPGPLGNVIFIKLKLRNGGFDTLNQAYVSLWADPDVGGFSDDLAGCDTTLSLGFGYNATNADAQYGAMPPAVGFQLLQGPIVPVGGGVTDTLGMTAFTMYGNGTDPSNSIESYNTMRGRHADGTLMHVNDDTTAAVTTFQVAGDPVTGTEWLDHTPRDRRMQVAAGPFTLAPGEEQEIVAAIVVGQGSNRLSSITEMRGAARAALDAYRQGFVLTLKVSAPVSRSVDEGTLLAFNVIANDPMGGALTLQADGLPVGATFLDHGDGTGAFSWIPGFDQAGEYPVVFTVRRGDGSSASATTQITVRNVNRAPVADADGPYTTFVGIPATLDGSGSSDADGDLLSYLWDFGDGGSGAGPTPAHTYAVPGLYDVLLTVSDGAEDDTSATSVSVLDALVARAFTSSGNRSIRLASGKATWCVEIEPVGRSFAITSVDLASIVMKSAGTGSVSEIHALGGKSSAGSDRDGNSVPEITACFGKEDLRLLFGALQGQASVPVSLEGNVLTGGFFRAQITIAVQGGGGAATVATTPVPLRGRGAFEFRTTRPGPVSIRLFDVSGRLVRSVTENRTESAGFHRVEFDTRDDRGGSLGGGVYFYRVHLPEGTAVGRVVVVP